MHENETVTLVIDDTNETTRLLPTIPKPVFIRLLILFCGGIGCFLVGIIVTITIRDFILLAMSIILSIAFVTKGFLIKRIIKQGQIYSVSGVCISLAPKMLGRYRRIELVDTITGGEVSFLLPKKTLFKVGHVYTCYFDTPIINHSESITTSKGGFFNAELDLPTNGFLGFEDFGIYQEKPIIAPVTIETSDVVSETPNSGESPKNEKEKHP